MSKTESPGALEVSLVDAVSSFELRHYFRTSIFPNSAQQVRVGAQLLSLPPWKVSK